MSSIGSRQKVRLFVEGREIPFISATLVCQVGAPISATISMVPLKEIKFIKPRTQVCLYLQDTKNFPDDDFYLVFEGEVLGRSRAKQQDSRSFSVVALDYSSYWDEAKVYTMSPNFTLGKIEDAMSLQDGPVNQVVKALGGKVFQTSSTANVRIIELILGKKADGSVGNKDLAQGVVNVIKELAVVNQFYATAFERLRISDRVNLFSSQKLQDFLQDLAIEEFLRDFAGKFGGKSSLRDLLYSVLGLVFHDFVSVPFPAYIKPSTVTSTATETTVTNPPSQAISLAERTSSAGRTLSSLLFVPDCYTLPAPMCNVIFPNQQQGYAFSEDFRALPTRYSFRASMPLMTAQETVLPQYPTQFFPTAFSDYMFGKRTATDAELDSSLGPSSLLTDKKTPANTYRQVFYGNSNTAAVGTAFDLVTREADYLSTEESLKGIYLESDTFMPSYTALIKTATPEARTAFIQSIGSYLFFKKRYMARPSNSELIFNPFIVPGFNAIFLDDSVAGQSFIAKLETVTHTLTNSGCATNVSLSHGRDFDEVDELTGGSGDPPTPTWFDEELFGKIDAEAFGKETAYLKAIGAIDDKEVAARAKITTPTTFPNIDKFFQALLGCNSVTQYDATAAASGKTVASRPQLCSVRGAVSYLLFQYNNVKNSPDAVDKRVRDLTSRPLAPLVAGFDFIRAQPVGFKKTGRFTLPQEYAVFEAKTTNTDLPGRFDGTGYADEKAVAFRRTIIDDYVKILKTGVGFRG